MLKSNKLRDYEIREGLRRHLTLAHQHEAGTVLFEELGVSHGQVRADLVVVNGHLNCYEIKSECDTLERLPNQIAEYNKVFDYCTLVVPGGKNLDQAMCMIPTWWSVCLPERIDGGMRFVGIRPGLPNPQPDNLARAGLLWRDEAIELLNKLGHVTGLRSKPREDLYRKIVTICETDSLADHLRGILKQRASQNLWNLKQMLIIDSTG